MILLGSIYFTVTMTEKATKRFTVTKCRDEKNRGTELYCLISRMVDCGSKDVWELLPRGIYVKWLRLFFFLY
jgi:hypothetical protein